MSPQNKGGAIKGFKRVLIVAEHFLIMIKVVPMATP